MTNLGWLRQRIWIALALPAAAAACGKKEAKEEAKVVAHDAAPVVAKPVDAAPVVLVDAAVAPDAQPVPLDAAPAKPKLAWKQRNGGCGGISWCLAPSSARGLA